MLARWRPLSDDESDVRQSAADLSLAVLRGPAGSAHSRAEVVSVRRVYDFVGCSPLLEAGVYTLIPLSFNHYHLAGLRTYQILRN